MSQLLPSNINLMRRLLLLSSFLPHIFANAVGYSPFSNPFFGVADDSLLVKRQNNCKSGYDSCSNFGAQDACCPPGTSCQLDDAGRVACCSSQAYCTGTVGATGGANPTPSPSSGTSTTGFVLGGSTTTTAYQPPSLTTGVQGGGSTVINTYYPFVYIPTSYANAELCLSGYSQCQAESTACFQSLAGVNGVTVSGVGFGTTVQGATGASSRVASSVCSSLSQAACYNLQTETCNRFAGANPGGTQQGAGPRQTACPGMIYAAGAGAMMGAAGVLF